MHNLSLLLPANNWLLGTDKLTTLSLDDNKLTYLGETMPTIKDYYMVLKFVNIIELCILYTVI